MGATREKMVQARDVLDALMGLTQELESASEAEAERVRDRALGRVAALCVLLGIAAERSRAPEPQKPDPAEPEGWTAKAVREDLARQHAAFMGASHAAAGAMNARGHAEDCRVSTHYNKGWVGEPPPPPPCTCRPKVALSESGPGAPSEREFEVSAVMPDGGVRVPALDGGWSEGRARLLAAALAVVREKVDEQLRFAVPTDELLAQAVARGAAADRAEFTECCTPHHLAEAARWVELEQWVVRQLGVVESPERVALGKLVSAWDQWTDVSTLMEEDHSELLADLKAALAVSRSVLRDPGSFRAVPR